MSPNPTLDRGLQARPSSVEPGRLTEAAEAAMEFYARIHRPESELPEAYQPGGEWRAYCEERAWFYDAMASGDSETVVAGLTNFWRNQLGPIVSQYAYFSDLAAGDETKVERFQTKLAEDFEHWKSLWHEDPAVLEVPDVGNPWGLEIDGLLVTPLAMRFYNHARQIGDLLRDGSAPIVGEIGGGYGGMCHRAVTMNPELTYVDIDLPETLAIAAFYLLVTLPDRKIHLWDQASRLDRESILEHDIVLAPHYAYAQVGEDALDLVLNAFSLSEMKESAVTAYVSGLDSRCRRYFLQNNVDRTGVVNRGFERLPCSRYPLDPSAFKTLYFRFDTYQGPTGDYRESLHERISVA